MTETLTPSKLAKQLGFEFGLSPHFAERIIRWLASQKAKSKQQFPERKGKQS